jgi:prevent-host-death family protein
MKIVNIQAAKTHLSRLVEEAVAGEEIVLAKAGRPLIRLTPYVPAKPPRRLGQFRGRVAEAPGCWQHDLAVERAASH